MNPSVTLALMDFGGSMATSCKQNIDILSPKGNAIVSVMTKVFPTASIGLFCLHDKSPDIHIIKITQTTVLKPVSSCAMALFNDKAHTHTYI